MKLEAKLVTFLRCLPLMTRYRYVPYFSEASFAHVRQVQRGQHSSLIYRLDYSCRPGKEERAMGCGASQATVLETSAPVVILAEKPWKDAIVPGQGGHRTGTDASPRRVGPVTSNEQETHALIPACPDKNNLVAMTEERKAPGGERISADQNKAQVPYMNQGMLTGMEHGDNGKKAVAGRFIFAPPINPNFVETCQVKFTSAPAMFKTQAAPSVKPLFGDSRRY